MTVVEWTAVAGVLLAVISSVFIPIWLQRRKQSSEDSAAAAKEQADASSTTVVSWQGITTAIQKERDGLLTQLDDLRTQLDEIDGRARRRAQEIEADWEKRMAIAKQRITDLENEVAELRRELRAATPDDAA